MERDKAKTVYQEVLGLLPKLQPDELQQIALRVKALQTITGQSNAVADAPIAIMPAKDIRDDWLIDGYNSELHSRYGLKAPPFKVIEGMQSYRQYASYDTKAWLTQQLPALTKVEYKALGHICARSLAHYLESWTGLDLDNMLRHTNKLPAAINTSFPGYLQSGLMIALIRSRRGKAAEQPELNLGD